MALTNQVFLYSVCTDALYDATERAVHKKLLRLYALRKELKHRIIKYQNSGRRRKYENICVKVNKLVQHYKTELSNALSADAGNKKRELNPLVLNDKMVVSLFESSLTRAIGIPTNSLTDDLIILNVFFFQVFHDAVNNGFTYKGEKYIFLTASAGQIRKKRAVFIKESTYKRIEQKIMCGLTVDEINAAGGINPNKFCAYLALMSSATDVWEDFDIDKSIVVDDWETAVPGLVDHINEKFEIKRELTETVVPHMDGCGIMLDKPTRMVRLPFIKGLLVYFPFDEFIREKCGGEVAVTDIYGEKHKVIEEGIRYIFTKSQFKLYKYFHDWNCYKSRFKAFHCEASYCNMEENYIPKSRINYQMLQTLSDMTDGEMEKLVSATNNDIAAVGYDFQTTMRLLGATEYNRNPSYFQQSLRICPELYRDAYTRDVIKDTKRSLVKQGKAGRLKVNGEYLFLSPDLYGFCEWLFLGIQNPKGLLQDGEVYTKEFQNGDDLACLRSPHLYREWAIRKNIRNAETEKWFGDTKCIYTSCHDLITKIVMADCDGDRLLVIKDKNLVNCAKRNMTDIVPLAYDLRKAQPSIITNEVLYHGMIAAYTGGNIGVVSNNISKIWNSGNITSAELDAVKWLCYINNAVIDYAKTLWLPQYPRDVKDKIKQYTNTKLPAFFTYAKDKTKFQVDDPNNSTMNRISEKIVSSRIRWNKKIGRFDYRLLMNQDFTFLIDDDNPIIAAYDYWNKRQGVFKRADGSDRRDESYVYKKIKEKIISGCVYSVEIIVNSLVAYLYTVRTQSPKRLLWECFGEEMYKNLCVNLKDAKPLCPMCGKRHNGEHGAKYCSEECYKTAKQRSDRERYY